MDHAALFASVICEVVDQNRSLGLIQQLQQQANCSQSPFESTRAPSYPLERYLQRIARYATSSPSCFLIALVYMDRIIAAQHGTFVLSELNVHRLFMSCLVVATKFWSDHFYDNAFYGRVGGISAREMSSLEVRFFCLFGCLFSLVSSSENFPVPVFRSLHSSGLTSA